MAYELKQAAELRDQIADVKGVQMISYDETSEHYNNLSALYSVTFAYSEDDDACLDSLNAVKEYLSNYDLYVDTDLGNTQEETIDHEISVIMVYVAIVIVTVLLFTSETYGEVPVLILTFVVALVLNQGTNFMMGKISFISNSVTVGLGREEQHDDNDDGDIHHDDADLVVDGLLLRVAKVRVDIQIVVRSVRAASRPSAALSRCSSCSSSSAPIWRCASSNPFSSRCSRRSLSCRAC